MTATAEMQQANMSYNCFRKNKSLSQRTYNRRKALFRWIFTSSFRFWFRQNCINLGSFIDPACGCGNFLIITYRELRLLELEILKMKSNTNQMILDITSMLKVGVEQFYGIEYEDFPCQIATVGMWLIDHQMNLRVSDQFGTYYARLPLTQSATIVHGNALRIDWESVVPKRELSYILGNPPFKGFKMQTSKQREEMKRISDNQIPSVGLLDYVCGWYIKAAQYIQNTRIKCAFVSTNSISQCEQPSILWKYLFANKIEIDFAYRTFIWSNEATGNAKVHCVIIGFSIINNEKKKIIYDNDVIYEAKNINPFIIDCANILVHSQKKPICNVPPMIAGNKTVKCLALIMTADEKDELITKEPSAEKYIKQMIGAEEFINKKSLLAWCC